MLLSATQIGRAEDAPWSRPRDDESVYIFSFFRKNGEDGLYLAWSRDGLKWSPLNGDKPLLKPAVGEKPLMRDPCIARGPDGMFHMVWTTGWYKRGFGMAHSKNLIHWSEQKYVPAMEHEPTARNTWAPELFYDADNKRWLIFWASTIPGRFPNTENTGDDGFNHRMYLTTTVDFEKYTPTKLFYDGGFNVIDATLVKDGRRFVMFLKDETRNPVRKNIRIATAERAEGPYGQASEPITAEWVEGPTAVRLNDQWYVFYDEYTRSRYGAVRSKDLKAWQAVPADELAFPKGARHGTILRVPAEVVRGILDLNSSPR